MNTVEPLGMQSLGGQGGDHSESWDWVIIQPFPPPGVSWNPSKLPSCLYWRELDPPYLVVQKAGIGKVSLTHLWVPGAASPAVS